MTTMQDKREPSFDPGRGDADGAALPAISSSWPWPQPVLDAPAVIDRAGLGSWVQLLRSKMGFPREVFALAALPLVHGIAEFVQLLPVVGSRRDGGPGGQLQRALATALRALDRRRGQILPRGAAPEIIGAQAHRWTYAVFAAALLHDIAKVGAGLRIRLDPDRMSYILWDPSQGPMSACGAASYGVEILPQERPTDVDDTALAARVLEQAVPAVVQSWLGEDAVLVEELRAVLAGFAPPVSAIADLVSRAVTGAIRAPQPTVAEPERSVEVDPVVASKPEPKSSAPADIEPEFLEDVKPERRARAARRRAAAPS